MKKKKVQQESVLVLINTAKTNNLSNSLKLKLINEYCEDKNYNIANIKCQKYFDTLQTFDLLDYITDLIFHEVEITKIIICNVNEIATNYEKLFAISNILKQMDISIETIDNGVIGKDITFQLNVNKGEIK